MRFIARVVAATALVTSIGVIGASTSASAATACPSRSMSKKFAQWGDDNLYFTAPQATFEGSVGQWARSGGAGVVNDQAPWRINGSKHSKAMQLQPGASITLRSFCVAANEETLRFFYKSPGSGQLSVRMEVRTEQGTAISTWGFGTSAQGWGVSPIIKLPSLRDSNGDQWITLTFSSSGGTWLVDDVMIDPWIAR
jgi:hypothetical protein